jgi:predicted HAD superfamily Cof-like phosphohydrolase
MLKSITNFDKVAQFMKAMGQDIPEKSALPDRKTIDLRLSLIEEECQELIDAINAKDIKEVADALCDLLYVTYGAGHAFGIHLDVGFNNVHASNMSKLGEDGKPIYRHDGKVLKGPKYFSPNIERSLTF